MSRRRWPHDEHAGGVVLASFILLLAAMWRALPWLMAALVVVAVVVAVRAVRRRRHLPSRPPLQVMHGQVDDVSELERLRDENTRLKGDVRKAKRKISILSEMINGPEVPDDWRA